MSEAEYTATVGQNKSIKSTGAYSHRSEGTNFDESPSGAESYANFGRDDPRKTGTATYLVEVRATEVIKQARDGYWKAQGSVPLANVERVWRMWNKGGAIVACRVRARAR